jgi:hypothetical protein
MPSRPSIRCFAWVYFSRFVAALLVIFGLISPVTAAPHAAEAVILPDPKLIGCKVSTCSQVMPDPIADSYPIYPWKVLVDINEGGIIGLMALYDPSTSIDVIKASIDERYGKWAAPDFKTGPIMFWRIEPERLVISLSRDGNGISVIYLVFGAKHPVPPAPRANFSRFVAAALVTLGLTSPATAARNPGEHIILPDSKLIGCKVSTCSQVMPNPVADSHAVYPWQVSVDITDGTISGLTALYDPSISIDVIKASIDDRYGKWAVHGLDRRAKTWRLEPEKFVVSLAPADKVYSGMSSVSYLAFGAKHPVLAAAQICNN